LPAKFIPELNFRASIGVITKKAQVLMAQNPLEGLFLGKGEARTSNLPPRAQPPNSQGSSANSSQM
jgi:hypothetical protein